MPELNLKFTLPEERDEAKVAQEGDSWKGVAWDLDNRLRGLIKHAGDDVPEEKLEAYQEIRGWLYDNMEAHGVFLG